MAYGVDSAYRRQPHKHCKASPWQPSGGFALKWSDPSVAAAALPPPKGPPPTARDAEAHRTRAGDHLRGGAPAGDADRVLRSSLRRRVTAWRSQVATKSQHHNSAPEVRPFSFIVSSRASYHRCARTLGWYGSDGGRGRGLRGHVSCLRVKVRKVYHFVILTLYHIVCDTHWTN